MSKDDLCYSLMRFVLEVRKQSGEEYPDESLYEMLISLQIYLSSKGKEYKFLDDDAFIPLKNTLDSKMKELSSAGKRVQRRKAQIITYEEEQLMWEKGVLGSDTPSKLMDTLVYLFGLHFALRAGQEHRNLRFINSQIGLMTDENGKLFLRYQEEVSKSLQGGLKHRKLTPKCVDAYGNDENPDRCIIKLYQKYVSHRPQSQNCSEALYLRPLQQPNGDVWFSCQPFGIHKINSTVNRLCKAAGLTGYHTNHSLRATAASRLYAHNFDEQLICETTGHRSTSVRSYKCTSQIQRKAVSDTLSNLNVSTRSDKVDNQDHIQQEKPIQITVNVNLDK